MASSAIAIFAYKKLLQTAWMHNSVEYETKAYDGLSMQNFHKSDIKRWQFYCDRVDSGYAEDKHSIVRFLNESNLSKREQEKVSILITPGAHPRRNQNKRLQRRPQTYRRRRKVSPSCASAFSENKFEKGRRVFPKGARLCLRGQAVFRSVPAFVDVRLVVRGRHPGADTSRYSDIKSQTNWRSISDCSKGSLE